MNKKKNTHVYGSTTIQPKENFYTKKAEGGGALTSIVFRRTFVHYWRRNRRRKGGQIKEKEKYS